MSMPGKWQGGADGPDDSVLVQQALQGDRRAFDTLVLRYQRLVFRIVGGFLRNRADVEDVAQETFVRAFEALSTFRTGAIFSPWVCRIATRLCYDRLRRLRRAQEVAWEDLAPAQQRAAQNLAAGGELEDRVAIRDLADRALAALPPKERQVLLLADAHGLSAAEMAQTLGCTALAARIRLHRARRAMRRVIEPLLVGMEDAG